MSAPSKEQIEARLKEYVDPYLETDLVSAKAVKNIAIDGDKVAVEVRLGFPAKGYEATLTDKLKGLVTSVEGVGDARIDVSSKLVAHKVQKGVKPIE